MSTFGLKPSKIVGDIKEEIKEAILEGKIKNNPEEARGLMQNIAKRIGISNK
jgi:hypothetical protein